MHPLHEPVVALLRDVARKVVMPSFRNLSAADIEQKAPDDLVTAADRASEELLAAGLAAIDPAARIVGEEACAADPRLLERLAQGRLWLIDPIDGTNNYAAGQPPFGMMLALVEDGETIAGWIHDPVADRTFHARAGGGAFLDGKLLRTRGTEQVPPQLGIASYFMTPQERSAVEKRAADRFVVAPMRRCAADLYARVVTGETDVGAFRKVMPWDHAAGALLLAEAGGKCARADGTLYRIDDLRPGLIAAATPELWEAARAVV